MSAPAAPTLLFLTRHPSRLQSCEHVAASLQSVETSFLLAGIGRHPHALTTCASAIESCLQAVSAIAPSRGDGLQRLVEKARRVSPALGVLPMDELERLRELRNRITHRGFSPQDDSESVSVYLQVALPLLGLCYREFHEFDLLGALLPDYSRHLDSATRVLSLAASSKQPDLTYAVKAFAHTVRWDLKDAFASVWEAAELVASDEQGAKFERLHARKQALKSRCEAWWLFSCPVCGDLGAAVVALQREALSDNEIVPERLDCANCDFRVRAEEPFLAQVLLESQIRSEAANIFEAYL